MKLKLFIIGCLCFVAVITGICLISNNTTTMQKVIISADYPAYENLEKLTDKADTIIKGKIIDIAYTQLNVTEKTQSDNEFLNPGGEIDNSTMPYTIFTVEIKESYKGNVDKKNIIKIKQLGGIIGNTEYLNESAAKLKKGNNYVYFLETYPDSPASLLNPIQAVYEYYDNDIITSNKLNKIHLEMKDLDNIKNSHNKIEN